MRDLSEIKIKRRQLGLTQKQLAHTCQISQSLIAKIESGFTNPSYEIATKIITTLDKLEHKEIPKAKSFLNKNLLFVKSTDKIKKIIKIMKKTGISQIPITNKGNVIGSISEKSIILADEPIETLLNKRVTSVMTDPFPIISENTGIDTITDILRNTDAVLITKKGKIIGIITKTDLLRMG
jgi:predicted transcriptional regulator